MGIALDDELVSDSFFSAPDESFIARSSGVPGEGLLLLLLASVAAEGLGLLLLLLLLWVNSGEAG